MRDHRGFRVEESREQLAPTERIALAYGVRLETAPTSVEELPTVHELLADPTAHRHYRKQRLSNPHR